MRSRVRVQDVSYIISVSVGKGCYRHLRVSGQDTLHDFADTILWAFGFEHDHLYSFFMDDKWWSQEAAYHSPYAEEEPSADSIQLYRLKLEIGQSFKFLFDYGDEWQFQCKVLQVLDEATKEDEIVRIRGKAPKQYPDYDEDSDYDDDGDEIDPFTKHNAKIIKIDTQKAEEERPEDICIRIPNEVMEAAFRFRSEKLWKKLRENELFAVQLSGGEIGYCCITGGGGEYTALSLYIGDKGICSLDYLFQHPDLDEFNAVLVQNCLQLELCSKSDLPELLIEPLTAYAAEHGIEFKGKKQYPSLLKFQSYFMPHIITEQENFQYLLEALRAAHEVSEKLKLGRKAQLGFRKVPESMPLLIPENGSYRWETAPYPEVKPYSYPRPVIAPERADALKALPQKGKLESVIAFSSEPVFEAQSDRGYFPSSLFSAGTPAKLKGNIECLNDYPSAVNKIMEQFMEKMLKAGTRPAEIITNGECSLAFFSEFCGQCGIKLTLADKLPKVDKLLEQQAPSMQKQTADRVSKLVPMFTIMEQMPEEALRDMPDDLKTVMRSLLGTGVLLKNLEKKLKEIL